MPPKPTVEEKEKKLLLPKTISDARKSVRRLVRPRLKTEEVQQQDTEIPGAENAGKQFVSSRRDAAAEGIVGASSVQQPPRKRQLTSSAAELADQPADDGESALKRSKGLDLPQQDVSEGQIVEPAEEVLDSQPQGVDKDKDASGDIQMEDTQISTDKVEEDQQKEPLSSEVTDEENLDRAASGQGDMSGMAPSGDVVLIVEDQIEPSNNQQVVDESDKEEGELAPDVADPEEVGSGAGDVSPEAGVEGEKPEEAVATTPTASPIRGGEDVDAVLDEADNNSSLEAVPQDDEKGEEEGEIMDDTVADADAPSSKIETEQQQQQVSSEAAAAGESGLLPTPPLIRRSPSPSPSLSSSPGLSPSLTTVGSSSTTINLRERAREKAALRQAGALPSTTPSRGRAVRGRGVRGRGARTGRGGAQPPGDSGQGSR